MLTRKCPPGGAPGMIIGNGLSIIAIIIMGSPPAGPAAAGAKRDLLRPSGPRSLRVRKKSPLPGGGGN